MVSVLITRQARSEYEHGSIRVQTFGVENVRRRRDTYFHTHCDVLSVGRTSRCRRRRVVNYDVVIVSTTIKRARKRSTIRFP